MHKVVINDEFGGFALSYLATERLEDLGVDVSAFTDRFDRKAYNIPRHHPLLVKVVEELGKKASEEYSDLIVVTIPGTKYVIREYDGREWIETPEDIKWITVSAE